MKQRLLLLVMLALPMLPAAPTLAQQSISHGRFKDVRLYQPAGETRGVVLLLSGDAGWDAHMSAIARSLQAEGAMVAGVGTPALLHALEKDGDRCVFPDGDLENLSHFIQGYAKLPTYHTPLLAGYASGATLAYAVLAQAPADTFSGALTMAFCPELRLRKPLCKGEGVHFTREQSGFVRLLPARQLHAPWVTLQGAADASCPLSTASRFVGQIDGAALAKLPRASHDLSTGQHWIPPFTAAWHRIGADRTAALPAPPGGLGDLPLIEVPSTGAGDHDTFVVLLSGDGGWAGLDKEVAAALAARGIPVVGFDSLRYFWSKRTPEGLALDLDRVLHHYAAHWNRSRAVLVGYSQGADVLPFAVNRLPAGSRPMVQRTVLMGLGEKASFEFHLANWVGDDESGLPILPEVLKLHANDVVCLYGDDDDESLCPRIPAGHVTAEPLPGGHHFDGAYDELAARVLVGLR